MRKITEKMLFYAQYQLSNDLRLFFSTEETGKEPSSQHIVDVLQEALRKRLFGRIGPRDDDIKKDFNLLFDVLVREEEGGACA